MPRGRKPSTLKQMTDTKVDGAYADLKAIPDDEFGGRLAQEDMIALALEVHKQHYLQELTHRF